MKRPEVRFLRTVLARLMVDHLHRRHDLVIRAWFWLAAEADNLDENRRYLEAVRGSSVGESQHISRRGTPHCSFPFHVVKVPPVPFVTMGSTFQPLVVAF
jgi:hypothetical protein